MPPPSQPPSLPDIADLHAFTQAIGPHYGTEDFGVFLYALIKMQRPERVLELGTGSGVCAFWAARAMAENGRGAVLTIDDGSHWPGLRRQAGFEAYLDRPDQPYPDYLAAMARRFGIERHVTFLRTRLPPFPQVERAIDLLFSDFQHDPPSIVLLLRHFLPMMAPSSSVFIDSASTYLPSYLLLERLVEQFNAGRVPAELVRGLAAEKEAAIRDRVARSRFTLVHLTETKDRDQNSTAWIKIEPVDIVPYPETRMR